MLNGSSDVCPGFLLQELRGAIDIRRIWLVTAPLFGFSRAAASPTLTFSRHLAVQSALGKEKMRDIRKEMQRNACHISQCGISYRNFDHLVKWKD